ncbi:MAG: NDP-sugar synthase, partial [Oscillospiraceae bacterium]|nr:NDP-sugar synthase [Oscillospiraceae bacterium]
MKAVILAGGEGTRLRPVSLLRPKPMIRLFDKPLLEHTVELLRDNGFDEICMTLMYLPGKIRDHFGDGSRWNVSIEYRVEQTPLGTAGSVKRCEDFINGEEFIVVSGDAACRMDLRSFAEYRRSVDADAAIMLSQCFEPGEYGLVLTDGAGRVTGFIEKPSADRIYTDLVNTGIYMLTPGVLDSIPASVPCDFGSELFPALLGSGARIYARADPGYWNDVGSCGAYLRTSCDLLPQGESFVSPGAEVSAGCLIGPKAVIGSGSRIGRGSRISGSIVDGACIGGGCRIEGSIVCAGAAVGVNCRLSDGCVVGDGASIGAGSVIGEGVRIWPGCRVEEGSVVLHSVTGGSGSVRPVFDGDGVIRSEAVFGVTPRLCMSMGASSGGERRVAAASS